VHYSSQAKLPRKELDELVDQRIRYTIRLADSTIPFYHTKFKTLGINPSDIQGKRDLLKAFSEKGLEITKEEIIDHLEELKPAYDGPGGQLFWSSGSTGRPKAVRYSRDDYERMGRQGSFILDAMGLKEGDRFLSLLAPPPFTSGKMMEQSAEEYGLLYLQPTPVPPELLPDTIQRFKPHALTGLCSRIHSLPQQLKEKYNIDVKTFGIKSIGMGGEPMKRERRKEVFERWGIPYYAAYATAECGIIAGGCGKDCDRKDEIGIHVIEPYSLFSVMNSETREECSIGERGVDLVTTLFDPDMKPSTVMINVRHGDISSLVSYDICECGRTLKRIDHPNRIDNQVSIRGVKFEVTDVEGYLARTEVKGYFGDNYFCILNEDQQHLEVRLERKAILPQTITENLQHDVTLELLRSNPAGLSVMQLSDINVSVKEREKLYEGYRVPTAGKAIRLIRV
jgi:phenylacetate-coenzyme A ligase PaaK-like adenylate-forming protein